MQHLESNDESTLSAILLPPGFRLREGAELWGGVRIGRLLGSGMQVGSTAGAAAECGSSCAGARRSRGLHAHAVCAERLRSCPVVTLSRSTDLSPP